MKKLSSQGFSSVVALLLVLVIVAVGVVGYRVLQKDSGSESASETQTSVQEVSRFCSGTLKVTLPAGWKYNSEDCVVTSGSLDELPAQCYAEDNAHLVFSVGNEESRSMQDRIALFDNEASKVLKKEMTTIGDSSPAWVLEVESPPCGRINVLLAERGTSEVEAVWSAETEWADEARTAALSIR